LGTGSHHHASGAGPAAHRSRPVQFDHQINGLATATAAAWPTQHRQPPQCSGSYTEDTSAAWPTQDRQPQQLSGSYTDTDYKPPRASGYSGYRGRAQALPYAHAAAVRAAADEARRFVDAKRAYRDADAAKSSARGAELVRQRQRANAAALLALELRCARKAEECAQADEERCFADARRARLQNVLALLSRLYVDDEPERRVANAAAAKPGGALVEPEQHAAANEPEQRVATTIAAEPGDAPVEPEQHVAANLEQNAVVDEPERRVANAAAAEPSGAPFEPEQHAAAAEPGSALEQHAAADEPRPPLAPQPGELSERDYTVAAQPGEYPEPAVSAVADSDPEGQGPSGAPLEMAIYAPTCANSYGYQDYGLCGLCDYEPSQEDQIHAELDALDAAAERARAADAQRALQDARAAEERAQADEERRFADARRANSYGY